MHSDSNVNVRVCSSSQDGPRIDTLYTHVTRPWTEDAAALPRYAFNGLIGSAPSSKIRGPAARSSRNNESRRLKNTGKKSASLRTGRLTAWLGTARLGATAKSPSALHLSENNQRPLCRGGERGGRDGVALQGMQTQCRGVSCSSTRMHIGRQR